MGYFDGENLGNCVSLIANALLHVRKSVFSLFDFSFSIYSSKVNSTLNRATHKSGERVIGSFSTELLLLLLLVGLKALSIEFQCNLMSLRYTLLPDKNLKELTLNRVYGLFF